MWAPPPTSTGERCPSLCTVLAANVGRLRPARGFATVTALALAADVSKSRLYEILAGRGDTSIDCVALLARALNVRPSSLLEATTCAGNRDERRPVGGPGDFRNPAHGAGQPDPW